MWPHQCSVSTDKMAARFGTAAMLAFIIAVVFSALSVNADVPDDVVYTDVRKIVICGDDAVLKCQFLGTPLAVYWKKGNDPRSAPNLITWFGDQPHTGSCVEDRACEMADDFSLILKEVGMEDQGRYICRVSSYKGILVHNFTDVKVIDPDQLNIYTEPYVTERAGSFVNLPCNFTIEAKKVLWKKVYWDGGSKVETLLRYTSDGHEAPLSRKYSWSENYGLIIRDLHVSDEGNFTCLVSSIDGIKIKNSTVLVVNESATQSTTIITVVVVIILVLIIYVMIRTRQYILQNDNTGTRCQTITRDWFRWVFCWKKVDGRNAATDRTGTHAKTKQGEVSVAKKMKDDKERQGFMDMVEQEKKLDNLREKLKKYKPRNDTEITEGYSPVINLGVFGLTGSGKSTLINSINFALTNKYEDDIGAVTKYRDSTPLAEHINIIDNRGMKDFSGWQVDYNFIPEIRGERGQDPDKKILNGDVIHCPIFVHNISIESEEMQTFLRQFSSAVHNHYGRHVMVVFTHKDEAKDLESVISATNLSADVPEKYICSFENYTDENNTHDVGKSIAFLEFLEKCLKVGEMNIQFEMKKKKEVPTGWCTIQ